MTPAPSAVPLARRSGLPSLRAAFEHLRKPGASVINISAQQGAQPVAMQVHACAAKAGVDQVTRVLAIEWGPAGVRVNGISAGPIKTLAASGIKDLGKLLKVVAAAAPLRRNVTIEDVGNVAAFLLSDMASGVTAEISYVDGGFSQTAGLSADSEGLAG